MSELKNISIIAYLWYRYTNDFLMTKEILRKIIKIETEHIDCFKNRAAGVIKKASKVQTLNIDGRVWAEYQKLYVEYK